MTTSEPDDLRDRFRLLNLQAIRAALDHHNSVGCDLPARAILLNPFDHEVMGFDSLWGLPVLADENVPVKRVRIDCEGSAHNIERELQIYTESPDVWRSPLELE